MADALSQETRFKSGVPQGSVVGPLLFLLFVNDLPSVINVATLLFADDVKVVSPRSQNDLLQNSLNNVRRLSVNYIDIGRTPPLQLSLATGSPGNSMQVANFVKDLSVLMDYSFSPSIHCREAAPKARWILFMMKRSFAELSLSAFAAHYNTLVRPHLEFAMQACSLNFVADADCLEQIQRLAGSVLLTQAPPPWRPHSRIQNVFRRIGSGPQPLFLIRQWGLA